MRRRGATLIEALVGTGLLAVLTAAVLPVSMNLWKAQQFSVGMPGVQEDARQTALTLANALRGATLCTSGDHGCTLNAPTEGASTSGITVYQRNPDGSLTELAYGVAGGNFNLTTGGTTTTLTTDVTLTLTFYGSATYNSGSLSPYTPTDATLTNLAAVGIVSTVVRNGLTGNYSTLIRLRNSPKAP